MKFENGQVEMNLVDGLPSLINEPNTYQEILSFAILIFSIILTEKLFSLFVS